LNHKIGVMIIPQKSIFILLVCLITLCSGCSTASSSLKVDYSGIEQLSNTGNMEIVVICKSLKAEKEKSNIEKAVLLQMQKLGVFKNVYTADSGANYTSDLRMEITVTAIKPVSASARFLVGAMAGQGKVEANIDLFDLSVKKQILWAKVSGVTSTGSALAGTTQEAINQLAEAIGKIFQEKMNKPALNQTDKAMVAPVSNNDFGQSVPLN
jgi:Domain of unknown function (DUF4410)